MPILSRECGNETRDSLKLGSHQLDGFSWGHSIFHSPLSFNTFFPFGKWAIGWTGRASSQPADCARAPRAELQATWDGSSHAGVDMLQNQPAKQGRQKNANMLSMHIYLYIYMSVCVSKRGGKENTYRTSNCGAEWGTKDITPM